MCQILKWTVPEVSKWICSLGQAQDQSIFDEYAKQFEVNGVDGSTLFHDITDPYLRGWILNDAHRSRITTSLAELRGETNGGKTIAADQLIPYSPVPKALAEINPALASVPHVITNIGAGGTAPVSVRLNGRSEDLHVGAMGPAALCINGPVTDEQFKELLTHHRNLVSQLFVDQKSGQPDTLQTGAYLEMSLPPDFIASLRKTEILKACNDLFEPQLQEDQKSGRIDVIVVSGIGGVGKTYFAEALALLISSRLFPNRVPDFLFKVYTGSTPEQLNGRTTLQAMNALLAVVDPTNLKDTQNNADRAIAAYQSYFSSKSGILLFDATDGLSDRDIQQLMPLPNRPGRRCVVIATSMKSRGSLLCDIGNHPKPNVYARHWEVGLEPVTELGLCKDILEQAYNCHRSNNQSNVKPEFKEQELKQILTLTGGLPLAMRFVAASVARQIPQNKSIASILHDITRIDIVTKPSPNQPAVLNMYKALQFALNQLSVIEQSCLSVLREFPGSFSGDAMLSIIRSSLSDPHSDSDSDEKEIASPLSQFRFGEALAVLMAFGFVKSIGADRYNQHDIVRVFCNSTARWNGNVEVARSRTARAQTDAYIQHYTTELHRLCGSAALQTSLTRYDRDAANFERCKSLCTKLSRIEQLVALFSVPAPLLPLGIRWEAEDFLKSAGACEKYCEALNPSTAGPDIKLKVARVYANLGYAYELQTDSKSALKFFRSSEALHSDNAEKAAVSLRVGTITNWLGDFNAALDYMERGRALYAAAGDQRGVTESMMYHAWVVGTSDPARAEAELKVIKSNFEALEADGISSEAASTSTSIGTAAAAVAASSADRDEFGAIQWKAIHSKDFAFTQLRQNKLDAGLKSAPLAIEFFSKIGDRAGVGDATRILADIEREKSWPVDIVSSKENEIAAKYDDSYAAFSSLRDNRNMAVAYRSKAWLLWQTQPTLARKYITEAAKLTPTPTKPDAAQRESDRGMLLVISGDFAGAVTAYRQSSQQFGALYDHPNQERASENADRIESFMILCKYLANSQYSALVFEYILPTKSVSVPLPILLPTISLTS